MVATGPGKAHLALKGCAHAELEQELDEAEPPGEDVRPVSLGTDRVLNQRDAPEGNDCLERRLQRKPERAAQSRPRTVDSGRSVTEWGGGLAISVDLWVRRSIVGPS